jgi:TonB family protein
MAAAAPEGRVLRDTGFGNTNSREKPRSAETLVELTPVMFNTARATQGTARADAAPPAPRVTPVEVLSKPTPIYTEEARKLKIEGDVLLEVEFSCTGTIRILRVVRGLGYGLDEAAVRAAQQIRFKPAHDSGQPVDSRATVNIIFRLA